MTSPFSAESVNNGVFTKFISIIVIAIMTIGAGVALILFTSNGGTLEVLLARQQT